MRYCKTCKWEHKPGWDHCPNCYRNYEAEVVSGIDEWSDLELTVHHVSAGDDASSDEVSG